MAERLNDPTVAAALVTLLDHAEMLSTLVLGLGGVIQRSESIMDAVAEGVNDFKAAGGPGAIEGAPSLADLGAVTGQLAAAEPVLGHLLNSSMTYPETIDLLGMMSEAAVEGVTAAKANGTTVSGVRGAMKAMKDPEVQKGLGLMLEIARALGRRV